MDIPLNWLRVNYCYTHNVSLNCHERSFVVDDDQHGDLNLVRCRELKDYGELSLKWSIYTLLFCTKSQGTLWKSRWKGIRNRDGGWLQVSSRHTARQLHIQTHNRFDSILKSCEPQARPNPSLDWGGEMKFLLWLRRYRQLVLLGEGVSVFFKSVAIGRWIMPQ